MVRRRNKAINLLCFGFVFQGKLFQHKHAWFVQKATAAARSIDSLVVSQQACSLDRFATRSSCRVSRGRLLSIVSTRKMLLDFIPKNGIFVYCLRVNCLSSTTQKVIALLKWYIMTTVLHHSNYTNTFNLPLQQIQRYLHLVTHLIKVQRRWCEVSS